ncbi:hypothetical protein R6Q57_024583 [Mikania cordata]
MGHQKAIDYDLLAELGQQERMMAIIGEDTPWSRLFEMTPQAPDFQPQPEFGSVLGLYTEEETHMTIYTTAIHTADDAVVSAWWPRIGDGSFVRSARVTRIRDPLIRYLHRCIPRLLQDVARARSGALLMIYFFLLLVVWETVQPCTVSGGVF